MADPQIMLDLVQYSRLLKLFWIMILYDIYLQRICGCSLVLKEWGLGINLKLIWNIFQVCKNKDVEGKEDDLDGNIQEPY